MKILFLINEFERNGAERVVSYLLKYLPETIPESKLYLYLLEQSEIGYEIPESVEVIVGSRYHTNGFIKVLKIFLLAYKIKRYVKLNNIDTIFSFLSRSNYVNILSTMMGSSHRALVSERHTPSQKYNNKNIKNWINRKLIRSLYPKCNEIIAVSKGVKNDLEVNFNIQRMNISVIYNPFPIEEIEDNSKRNIDHKWLGDKQFKLIATLGRLEEPKNHAMLIKAFDKITDKMPNARLIIIGEGSMRSNLTEMIKSLSLEKKVELIGRKENPFPYLANADVFVLSSDTEGFPNVIVESMICGCPVISTDCPSGPNEIIDSGKNGILVPVNDVDELSKSIIAFFKNDDLRIKIKENIERSVQHFELRKIISQYATKIKSNKQLNHS